jgi:Zn-dependent protease with chaperone function
MSFATSPSTRSGAQRRPYAALLWVVTLLVALCPGALWAANYSWNVDTATGLQGSSSIALKAPDGSTVEWIEAPRLARLQRVRDRIARASGIQGASLFVTNGVQPNAFAGRNASGTPMIAFTLPLLREIGDDEGLIAAVMGHEYGHLAANHTGRGERQGATQLLGVIAGIVAGATINNRLGAELAARAADLGGRALILSYDRDQEREADALGVRYMTEAGFDPQDASRYWRLAMQRFSASGGLFTTHPSTDERIANVGRIASESLAAARSAPPAEPVAGVASPGPNAPVSALPTPSAPVAPPALASSPVSPTPVAETSAPAPADTALAGPASTESVMSPIVVASISKTHEPTVPAAARERLNATASPARDGLWGYTDRGGAWVIEAVFVEAKPFGQADVAPVAVLAGTIRKWGFIDSSGRWEIPARFDGAEPFDAERPGLARVRVGGGSFGQDRFINRRGEFVD